MHLQLVSYSSGWFEWRTLAGCQLVEVIKTVTGL